MTAESPSPSRLRLGRKQRLRNTAEFARVYNGRCSASDGRLLVYALENETGATRLGVSVSRKVGGAVARNRWKRVLREAFRRNQEKLPAGLDYVLVPRGDASPQLSEISESLVALCGRVVGRLQSRRRGGGPTRQAKRRVRRNKRGRQS